jgi:hypothetical protein
VKSSYSGVVKWVVAIVCLVGVISTSFGQSGEVYSLNVVGFQKVTAPASKLQISATPFDQANPNIDSAIGNQLTGSDSFGSSDNILLWDVQGQKYSNYFVAGGVGEPYDGHWFTPALVPATNFPANIQPGQGFWIRSRQPTATQTVVLAGDVPADGAITNQISGGLQILSYPYSTPRTIEAMSFSNGGVGGDSYGASDNIMLWDYNTQSYSNYFLAGGVGAPFDGHWFTPALVAATNFNITVQPGQGFWYRHRGSGFNWVETKPYTVP